MLSHSISVPLLVPGALLALSQEELLAVPAWAAVAVTAMEEHGFRLTAGEALTRGDTAQILYLASCLAAPAEGEI